VKELFRDNPELADEVEAKIRAKLTGDKEEKSK
jgi:hypothetical protein